jgi:tetratricopeptide (TPR) repeat protein
MIDRRQALQTINAARIAKRYDYARSVAADWLSAWPGDIAVQIQLARCEFNEGMLQSSVDRLLDAVQSDPENPEAYEVLASALSAMNDNARAGLYACCGALLRRRRWDFAGAPPWADHLEKAIAAQDQGDHTCAVQSIQQVLAADPDLQLPMLIAMQAQRMAGNARAALALARTGHNLWPECLPFLILLAEDRFESSDDSRGVDYLHQVAGRDPSGEIAERYLGSNHPYQRLWPREISARLSRPIPSEVAAVFGKNRIGAGATTLTHEPTGSQDEAMRRDVRAQPSASKITDAGTPDQVPFSEVDADFPKPMPWEAFRGPDPGNPPEGGHDPADAPSTQPTPPPNRPSSVDQSDDRMPAYIVLSSRTRLAQAFGEERFQRLDDAVIELVETIRAKPEWSAYRYYVDDPASVDAFGLTAVDPGNAWHIKLRLADLDAFLAKRGEMIGALLIVGGDEIVPFHLLPNTTDDDDDVVPSDNPYGTLGENYFTPEWPVGRLPIDKEPELLVELLRESAYQHQTPQQTPNPFRRLLQWLKLRFDLITNKRAPSMGYTASIWRKASLAVYRAIGEPGSLIISPPTAASDDMPVAFAPSALSYFNLHGLEDAAEWYGQRDPFKDEGPGPDFPIALRPQDVVNGGGAASVVFTEACYGANIAEKTSETALCLKFLSAGCRAVVGSTKVSYGSLAAPLIAADLLGRLFWENINQGMTTGEALRSAKLTLASEMHRRQGFLDGEDQKTLISFVLYGDPLFRPHPNGAPLVSKAVLRRKLLRAELKASSTKSGQVKDETSADENIEQVRALLTQYLPGMADARCEIQPQYVFHLDDLQFSREGVHIKRLSPGSVESTVFSFSKTIIDGDRDHNHYARLTLDATGKVMKLAVSR